MAIAAPRRCADGDEDGIRVADAAGRLGEFEPALAHIGLDQIRQPRLEDRYLAALERSHSAGVLVDTGYAMTEIGKTRARHQPDISGAYHRHAHHELRRSLEKFRGTSNTQGTTPWQSSIHQYPAERSFAPIRAREIRDDIAPATNQSNPHPRVNGHHLARASSTRKKRCQIPRDGRPIALNPTMPHGIGRAAWPMLGQGFVTRDVAGPWGRAERSLDRS